MKNRTIIMLCLISLSSSVSLFPFSSRFSSFPLPSIPLDPSFIISFMKDPLKEMSKIYCSLKNPKLARECVIENYEWKIVDYFKDCMLKLKYMENLDEMTDFYCKKMNEEESAKAKACLDPGIINMITTDLSFAPIALKCMLKSENSEK